MKEQTQNVIVGLTVLGALVVLAGMIFLFAKLPGGFKGGYELDIVIDNTGGVKEGDTVYMRGLRVGHINRIRFADEDDPDKGIKMTAQIDHDVKVSRDTICYITRNVLGTPWIELKRGRPGDLRDRPPLPDDTILGKIEQTGPLAELKPALKSLTDVADGLMDLMGPRDAPDTPAEQAGIRGVVVRLNRTLDEFHAFAADARTSVARVTDTVTDTGERVEQLAGRLVHSADKLSQLMTTLNQIATKIDEGEGTAGRFINDDRLYREFIDTADQMSKLMGELRELVAQWKDKGVRLKLE